MERPDQATPAEDFQCPADGHLGCVVILREFCLAGKPGGVEKRSWMNVGLQRTGLSVHRQLKAVLRK
jgi:hypothetical protein